MQRVQLKMRLVTELENGRIENLVTSQVVKEKCGKRDDNINTRYCSLGAAA